MGAIAPAGLSGFSLCPHLILRSPRVQVCSAELGGARRPGERLMMAWGLAWLGEGDAILSASLPFPYLSYLLSYRPPQTEWRSTWGYDWRSVSTLLRQVWKEEDWKDDYEKRIYLFIMFWNEFYAWDIINQTNLLNQEGKVKLFLDEQREKPTRVEYFPHQKHEKIFDQILLIKSIALWLKKGKRSGFEIAVEDE